MQNNEADMLDTVRRLRQNAASLDTCNWLLERTRDLNDPLLNTLIDEVYVRVNQGSQAIATLLKHIENNKAYRDIVKKYKSTNYEDPEDI